MGIAGGFLVVLGLMDAMVDTRTVEARDAVTRLLDRPPYSGMGLSVDQMLSAWRVVVLVAGGLASTAFVCAIYVFRRHNGARIAFTVAAGLLVLAIPVVGVLPVVLAVAAIGLWSEPARDWFAGRKPRPVATEVPAGRHRGQGHGGQLPASPTGWLHNDGSNEPPSRPPAGPAPTAGQPGGEQPPPSEYPYGSGQGQGLGESVPQEPGQPVQYPPPGAPQPGYPPQPYPAQSYPGQPYQQQAPQPYPPQHQQQAHAQPYLQQGYPYGYPPQQPPTSGRPSSVTLAAILTWASAGVVLLVCLVGLLFTVIAHDDFVAELEKRIQTDASLQDLDLTGDQLASILIGTFVVLAIWCLIAVVVAFFAFRGRQWARIVLTVSTAVAALISLIGILSLVSLLTLVPSVATLVLLFTRSSNAFFRGNRSAAPPPQQQYTPGAPW